MRDRSQDVVTTARVPRTLPLAHVALAQAPGVYGARWIADRSGLTQLWIIVYPDTPRAAATAAATDASTDALPFASTGVGAGDDTVDDATCLARIARLVEAAHARCGAPNLTRVGTPHVEFGLVWRGLSGAPWSRRPLALTVVDPVFHDRDTTLGRLHAFLARVTGTVDGSLTRAR